MKKTLIKRVISLWLVGVLFSLVFITPISAATAEPCYNNVRKATTIVTISDTGVMHISNSYTALKDNFSKAVITTYIEKRRLGIFWKRVDIGQPDNQWVDKSTNYLYSKNRTFQLASTGTYRVTVTFVISGSGGAADTITVVKKAAY